MKKFKNLLGQFLVIFGNSVADKGYELSRKEQQERKENQQRAESTTRLAANGLSTRRDN